MADSAIPDSSQSAAGPVTLELHLPEQTSDFARRLGAVAEAAEQGSDGTIGLIRGDGRGPPGVPALSLRTATRSAIHYLAVPEGPEEAPFTSALHALAGAPSCGPVGAPTAVQVFILANCPNCPHAVRAATSLAVKDPQVVVSIIDAAEFSDLATACSVRSVPTTIIDGLLTLVGVVSEAELAQNIRQQNGPDGEGAVFTSLVRAGRFAAAAQRLGTVGALDSFAEMWLSSTMETRIALMLAAEEALESGPPALEGLAPRLLPALSAADSAIRGDTADLLGQIGHSSARPGLEKLLADPHPDVAEAAAEALTLLGQGSRRC